MAYEILCHYRSLYFTEILFYCFCVDSRAPWQIPGFYLYGSGSFLLPYFLDPLGKLFCVRWYLKSNVKFIHKACKFEMLTQTSPGEISQ